MPLLAAVGIDDRMAELEERVKKLEKRDKARWRVVGQLHSYMLFMYEASKVPGTSLRLAFDYAVYKVKGLEKAKKEWGTGSPEDIARYDELAAFTEKMKGKLHP